MIILKPNGLSLTKVSITLLIWISFYLSFSTFILNFKNIKKQIPNNAFKIFIVLILWNLICIFRSFFNETGTITTLFGNVYTSLALLIPFSLAFGVNKNNLKTINRFFIITIIIGITGILLSFGFSGKLNKKIYYFVLWVLISVVVFLITTIPFQHTKTKFIIFVASILILYLSSIFENRAMIARISLLYLTLIALYFYMKFKLKWILVISIFSLIIPFYLLRTSIDSGQSIFKNISSKEQSKKSNSWQNNVEKSISNNNTKKLFEDSRTFLYEEVYKDLKKNKKLLFGKGSNGRYYSKFFHLNPGDSDSRLTVEVGILALLLKGGFIAVFLNLVLLFIAIYLAFFRTNNYFVIGVGFMLLVHTLLLFIENVPCFSIYNMAIWFFIGVCLSKEIRMLNNKEIKSILLTSNKKSIFL